MYSLALIAQFGRNQGGDASTILGIACCFGLVVALVSVAIGGGLIQMACGIVAAPTPSFGKAMGVSFVTYIVNTIVGLAVIFVMMAAKGGPEAFKDPEAIRPLALLSYAFSIPLNLIVSSGIYSMTLERVSFAKGMLIWLIIAVITFIIFFVLGFVVGFLGVVGQHR